MVEQRTHVLDAVALADWTGERTIARVTVIAGVGQSTIYEYFDDFDHAVRLVSEQASAFVHERLANLTLACDRGGLRALCEAWMLSIDDAPLLFLSALSRPGNPITPPARVLERRVLEWSSPRGTQSPAPRSNHATATDADSPVPTTATAGMALMLAAAAECMALTLAKARLDASGALHSPSTPESTPPRSTPEAPNAQVIPRQALGESALRTELTQLLADAADRMLAPR